MSAAALLLALVTAQRLAELALARANTRRLLAEGAVESGADHYPLFALVHGGWLLAMAVAATMAELPLETGPLVLLAVLVPMRLWVMASLGRFWTTRIIVLPGTPPVASGPYRWLRHPNYLVVAGEVAVVPMAMGLWGIAAAFSALNGMLLAQRIAAENAARGEVIVRGTTAAAG